MNSAADAQSPANGAKMGLGTYPYINARVRAMKADLIPESEYLKLAKMSLPEIARYLQDTRYKEEINELAQKYSGAELVERAINANIGRAFTKILAISAGEVRELLDAYLGRWDLWNLKAIMRAKHSKAPAEELELALLSCGRIGCGGSGELCKKETVEDVLLLAEKEGYAVGVGEALKAYKATGKLSDAENTLNKAYYSSILAKAEGLPQQGKLFRAFLKTELDIRNIKTILRLKREGFKKEDIMKHLIFPGEKLGKSDLSKLAGASSMDELGGALMKTYYGQVLGDSMKKMKEKSSISPVQTALDKYWLGKAGLMLHQHPLSINPIMGFLISKEIEHKNIRLIARARATGLPEDTILENLVA